MTTSQQNNPNLDTIQAVISDMDGVLWRGDTPLPGFHSFFQLLQTRNIPFILATNNARRTVSQYVEKFARLGVTITPENLMTSAMATGRYLHNQFSKGSRIYIVGEDGLYEAVEQAGMVIAPDESQPVSAVVAGLDQTVTYAKLRSAVLLINRGAQFIGSNGDLTFPFEGGMAPGAGSILAAIHAATGKAPTVIGKPEALMFEIALQQLQTAPTQTLMIGDRLETDILGGQRANLRTLLVKTGVDSEETVPIKGIQPDWILPDLAALVEAWSS